jgi:hypothetical protein
VTGPVTEWSKTLPTFESELQLIQNMRMGRHENTVQHTYAPSDWDKENLNRIGYRPQMDLKGRSSLLKPSFDTNFAHDCSSWLSNHPESTLRDEEVTPLTWCENVYRVEIQKDAVDLICIRRKFHQFSNRDQRNTRPDQGSAAAPKKFWQIFGEGDGKSQSRSISRRSAVDSPPILAPQNQLLRHRERPPQPIQHHLAQSSLTSPRLALSAATRCSAEHRSHPAIPSTIVAWSADSSATAPGREAELVKWANGQTSPYSAAAGTRRPANTHR